VKAQAGSGLLTIAEKEFFDHIRSKKFLLIFGIFLVIAIVGMIGGITDYNKNLDTYNGHRSVATSSAMPGFFADKPSILSVFGTVATYLVYLGGILGIAMGFDLITKEKESKSLKILLSHPVYRDEVINGKALGGIFALGCALGVVLIISLATLLIYGIIPDTNEMLLIAVFGAVSFLLIFSYFAIALFMSTVSQDSGSALIYTIIIFIALSVLVPTIAQDTVMDTVIGSQPALPQELLDQMQVSVNSTTTMGVFAVKASNAIGGDKDSAGSGAWQKFNQQMQAYWEKRQAVHDSLALFSPSMNYDTVVSGVTATSTGDVINSPGMSAVSFSVSGKQVTDTGDIVGKIAGNVVALLLFPAIFFGLAYVRFMRLDVR